jgi:hypothetical protein
VSEQTQASTESYVGQLVEQLRVLQERLRRIVEEVEREPGKQVTLAQDMADVHSETARLLLHIGSRATRRLSVRQNEGKEPAQVDWARFFAHGRATGH